jgi:Fur family transcriptional regulator, ferric uptake regulator
MKQTANDARSVHDTLEQLRETGFRITEPRKEVVREIHERNGVFSGERIYEDLRLNGSNVGRATVFRTIEVLVDVGALERVHQPDGSHAYVLCGPGHHHHMVCSACGEVVEFRGCNVDELIENLSDQTNFKIEGHWLEIFGTCARCQQAAD